MSSFFDQPLRLLSPRFDTPLVRLTMELEHLRRMRIESTTHPMVFMQLKRLFHRLESLASARIEGNRTTLADYVENAQSLPDDPASTPVAQPAGMSDAALEIFNIERVMQEVDQSVRAGNPISEHMLRSWHALAVGGLEREGDRTPGAYRIGPVQIAQSAHRPPEAHLVPQYMQELVAFVNRSDTEQHDLMKAMLAHHRFVWIHPFGNGNGRVVRLFTHALLIKYGFRVQMAGGLVNPAAVFCADRNAYCDHLAAADLGTDEGLERWCTYAMQGLLGELKKLERLSDYADLAKSVLIPAIEHAERTGRISAIWARVLGTVVTHQEAKSAHIATVTPGMSASQRSYLIRLMVEAKVLLQTTPNGRQYVIGFNSRPLASGVIAGLYKCGLISDALAGA